MSETDDDMQTPGGMSPDSAAQVKAALGAEKREQLAHGHDWDIADVMNALRTLGIETHQQIHELIEELCADRDH